MDGSPRWPAIPRWIWVAGGKGRRAFLGRPRHWRCLSAIDTRRPPFPGSKATSGIGTSLPFSRCGDFVRSRGVNGHSRSLGTRGPMPRPSHSTGAASPSNEKELRPISMSIGEKIYIFGS
jgi:hypothetical protein